MYHVLYLQSWCMPVPLFWFLISDLKYNQSNRLGAIGSIDNCPALFGPRWQWTCLSLMGREMIEPMEPCGPDILWCFVVRQGQGKNAYKDYKGQGDLNEISELAFAYFEWVGVLSIRRIRVELEDWDVWIENDWATSHRFISYAQVKSMSLSRWCLMTWRAGSLHWNSCD